jgi:hypothetical protein
MPQVWLTYEELGEHLECEAMVARNAVIECGWPRRRCSDQLTRVKLTEVAAHEYMLKYARKLTAPMLLFNEATDHMVAGLRQMLALADQGRLRSESTPPAIGRASY